MEHLRQLYEDFEQQLQTIIDRVWTIRDQESHLEHMASTASDIATIMIELGDHANEVLSETDSPDETHVHYFRMNYLWPEQAKSFLILWRDILFQQQKAQLLRQEAQIQASAIEELRNLSEHTVRHAQAELEDYPEVEEEQAPKAHKKMVASWKLQHNPWPTYREQLTALAEQCQHLHEQYLALQEVGDIFDEIRGYIHTAIDFCEKEVHDFENQAEKIIAFVHESIPNDTAPRLGKLTSKLEDFETYENLPHHLNIFTQSVEEAIDKIPERIRVPVQTSGGMIQYKEISFQRSIRQWLESKLLPVMYELWEVTENMRSSMKMGIVNIRNRTTLLAAELKEGKNPEIQPADIADPLRQFIDKTDEWERELIHQKKVVQNRTKGEFKLSNVYNDDEDYLPLPLQSTIRNLTNNQDELLNKVWTWLHARTGFVRTLIKTVEEEETLSASEKLVRFIQSSEMDDSNHDYTAIFLTKGYIGESFWVGRKDELAHMDKLVQNWEKGYRGGVVISGDRFSGKTLFGEVIANRYFQRQTIRLAPDSLIKVEGRRRHIYYDLGEALEFVRKYTLNTRPLIWIDDLELWWDHQTPLSKNIRHLQKALDNFPGKQFFMVSMNNWLKYHLNSLNDLNNVFHSSINLDRMSLEETIEAIWIRHSATNKILIDDQERPVTPRQFQKMVSKIYKAARANIGDSLNRWAASIHKVDEKRVKFVQRPGYTLPDFLTPDSELLLTAIMLQKRTNEYWLRKLFGPPFKDKYSNILNQLISMGLLVRDRDGWLEVHHASVNELGRMLEHKRALLAAK